MKRTILAIILLTAFGILSGCFSDTPIVDATKPWENHYFTVEQFNNGTKDIKLEKNESIWVLSNKTLNRTLQNVKNNK